MKYKKYKKTICRKTAARMVTSATPLVELALPDQSIFGP